MNKICHLNSSRVLCSSKGIFVMHNFVEKILVSRNILVNFPTIIINHRDLRYNNPCKYVFIIEVFIWRVKESNTTHTNAETIEISP